MANIFVMFIDVHLLQIAALATHGKMWGICGLYGGRKYKDRVEPTFPILRRTE